MSVMPILLNIGEAELEEVYGHKREQQIRGPQPFQCTRIGGHDRERHQTRRQLREQHYPRRPALQQFAFGQWPKSRKYRNSTCIGQEEPFPALQVETVTTIQLGLRTCQTGDVQGDHIPSGHFASRFLRCNSCSSGTPLTRSSNNGLTSIGAQRLAHRLAGNTTPAGAERVSSCGPPLRNCTTAPLRAMPMDKTSRTILADETTYLRLILNCLSRCKVEVSMSSGSCRQDRDHHSVRVSGNRPKISVMVYPSGNLQASGWNNTSVWRQQYNCITRMIQNGKS